MLGMRLADKPVRMHWRHRGKDPAEILQPSRTGRPVPGTPNPVTGKPTIGKKHAPSTRAHCETVLRSFYGFHLERNTGSLLVNPFPLVRNRRSARANAHHNPEKEHKKQRTGLYRPKVPKRIPRRIPDEKYTEVFAGLRSHRDRALLASRFARRRGRRPGPYPVVWERRRVPGRAAAAARRSHPWVGVSGEARSSAMAWSSSAMWAVSAAVWRRESLTGASSGRWSSGAGGRWRGGHWGRSGTWSAAAGAGPCAEPALRRGRRRTDRSSRSRRQRAGSSSGAGAWCAAPAAGA